MIMLIRGFLYLCSIVCLLSSIAVGASCVNVTDMNALDCLREEIINPKDNRDWEKYWNAFALAESHALRCDNLAETARFMTLRELTLGTATLEAFNESVERLVESNTRCFCEALLLVSDTNQQKVIKIVVPAVMVEGQESIDNKIDTFCGDEKYKKIRNIYKTARAKQRLK